MTMKYRSVVEALRELHAKRKPVIIRCGPPSQGWNFEGEEIVQRAVGAVAKMKGRPAEAGKFAFRVPLHRRR